MRIRHFPHLLHSRSIALCKINFNYPFENNLEIQTSLCPIANVCQYFTLRCPDHYSTVHSLKIDSNMCVQQAAILGHIIQAYILRCRVVSTNIFRLTRHFCFSMWLFSHLYAMLYFSSQPPLVWINATAHTHA